MPERRLVPGNFMTHAGQPVARVYIDEIINDRKCRCGCGDPDPGSYRRGAEFYVAENGTILQTDPDTTGEDRNFVRANRATIAEHFNTHRARVDEIVRFETAKVRSKELLVSLLTEEQRAEFVAKKFFPITGSTGTRYVMGIGWSNNIAMLDENDRRIGTLCAHPRQFVDDEDGEAVGELPVYDCMVTQMLAITVDERYFLNVAVCNPENTIAWETFHAAFERTDLLRRCRCNPCIQRDREERQRARSNARLYINDNTTTAAGDAFVEMNAAWAAAQVTLQQAVDQQLRYVMGVEGVVRGNNCP